MQRHDDIGATPLREYNEQPGYMGSSHYYEPSSGQAFQQQSYYPPTPDYGSHSYSQNSFTGAPPLSDSRFAAIISYSFGWLTGLLFLLFGGKDRFIRFHALQSLVFFGAINVIDFGVMYLIKIASDLRELWDFSSFLLIGCILGLLLLNFIAFVSWIVVMIQAGRGTYFRLPFVGDLVARCFSLNSRPRW